MSARFDCTDPAQLLQGLAEAEAALRRGELVVMPTDTVYGIAAEAFDPVAVELLLKAKGRGRDMPPPVLVGTVRAAMALVMDLADVGKDLIDEFWPGGLTIVCRSSPTLVWDLGETKGTVAVRMPLHPVALDLLKRTGPLAVSSANASGRPAATTADEAMDQLGDAVAVYLDGGPCADDVPSTIVDLTGSVPRLLRQGVITVERLREVIPLALEDEALADEVPVDAALADEVPVDEAPGGELSQHAIPEDGITGDENSQQTGKAVPAGPADPVSADPGDPGVVSPGAKDVPDQGNPADRDATG
jgi:tRNA threonylcarbamoyl adenosine modification protein (Sua5/YciO/YrdC/YwlC family)